MLLGGIYLFDADGDIKVGVDAVWISMLHAGESDGRCSVGKFATAAAITALLFSTAAHAACSFDRSQYDKVIAGMQVGEVEAAFGCKGSYQGRDVANGTTVEYYVWEVGPAYVSTRFRDGLLSYKVQRGLR